MHCYEEPGPVPCDPADDAESMFLLPPATEVPFRPRANGTRERTAAPFAGLYESGPDKRPSFGERVLNAFRGEPNTAPNPSVAEPGQDVKASYEARAYAALGLDRHEFETMDPIQRNNHINAAYAKMYLSEPETYKWAGMAAMASDKAGTGMLQSYMLELAAESKPVEKLGHLASAPDGAEVRRLLAKGNAGIFNDMYWQHLAFQQGGVEELERGAKEGSVTPGHLEGWRQLAAAKQARAAAEKSGDQAALSAAEKQIWAANKALLHGEQKHVQDVAYAESPESRSAFRFLSSPFNVLDVSSPIPGGTNFDDNRDWKPGSDKSWVPFSDDIGDFDQRWGWVEEQMLPEYMAFEKTPAMQERMNELVAQENTHPWMHKVLGPALTTLGRFR